MVYFLQVKIAKGGLQDTNKKSKQKIINIGRIKNYEFYRDEKQIN